MKFDNQQGTTLKKYIMLLNLLGTFNIAKFIKLLQP